MGPLEAEHEVEGLKVDVTDRSGHVRAEIETVSLGDLDRLGQSRDRPQLERPERDDPQWHVLLRARQKCGRERTAEPVPRADERDRELISGLRRHVAHCAPN